MVPPSEETTLGVFWSLRSPKEDAGVFAGRALPCTGAKPAKLVKVRVDSGKWHGHNCGSSPHHHRLPVCDGNTSASCGTHMLFLQRHDGVLMEFFVLWRFGENNNRG